MDLVQLTSAESGGSVHHNSLWSGRNEKKWIQQRKGWMVNRTKLKNSRLHDTIVDEGAGNIPIPRKSRSTVYGYELAYGSRESFTWIFA